MTPNSIVKSFQATGVWPMDADVVLKRFNNTTSTEDEDSELGQHGDGELCVVAIAQVAARRAGE